MDSRLKFLHHFQSIDEAVTQKDRASAVMVNRVAGSRPGGSEAHLPYGEESARPKMSRETPGFTLARKAAKESGSARTGNRRRWARRES